MLVKKDVHGQGVAEQQAPYMGIVNAYDAIARNMVILELSIEGAVLDANDFFLHLVGCALEDIQGKHYRALCDGQYCSAEHEVRWANVVKGSPFNDRVKLLGGGRENIWLEAIYFPVFDVRGVVVKIMKIAIESLCVERNGYDSSLINAVDRSAAIIEFDLEGRIVHVNENFLVITGYKRSEIVGRYYSDFYSEHSVGTLGFLAILDSVRSGRPPSGLFSCVDRKGCRLWFNALFNPLSDSAGCLLKVVNIAINETHRVKQKSKENKATELAYETLIDTQKISQEGVHLVRDIATFAAGIETEVNLACGNIEDLLQQSSQLKIIATQMRDMCRLIWLEASSPDLSGGHANEMVHRFGSVAEEISTLAGRSVQAAVEALKVTQQSSELANQQLKNMLHTRAKSQEVVYLAECVETVIEDMYANAQAVIFSMDNLSASNLR